MKYFVGNRKNRLFPIQCTNLEKDFYFFILRYY
jgi:hypothetical protein